ncbi:MAG TPA: ABC transporter substrate-binding protein [Syntrophomonadaceae bacterium]|nr:ABC transporter substrate-binding protein [Syntrophomonadaceae bacterium]
MSKKKLCLVFLMILSLLVMLSGCAGQDKPAVSNNQDKVSEFRIIQDDLKREVEVPNQPKRVLSLNSSMTEIVFQLGVVPVGKVNEYIISRPETENLPEISLENSPNIEMINKLEPDLIIAHAKNHAQILDSLESTGAAVVFVDPSKAENQLIGRADLIGEALNRQEEAAKYTEKITAKSQQLSKKIAQSPIKTALFIQRGSQNIMAAQSFCFWGRLLTDLGIENIVPLKVSNTSKAGFVTFDMETIIQKDPDVVLVLQPGFRSANEKGKKQGQGQGQKQEPAKTMGSAELLAMYKNDPMWQPLSAVKNDRILVVPINIAPGKISVLEALEVIAEIVAPE